MSKLWARVRTLVGVGILGVLFWRLGSGAFVDGLRMMNVWMLLAALGIGLLTTVFSAWRWCLTARGLGIRLPLHSAVKDYYQALFLNATLPGGLLGDVHRAVRHGKDAGDVGRGVRAVVLERTAGQVTLAVVAVLVLAAHPGRVLAELHRVPLGALAAGAALVVLAIVVASQLPSTSRWRRALATGVSDVRLGLLSRRNWPWIVLSSAVVLGGHLTAFLLAARAAGSTAPVSRLLPLMVLALLVMAVPLSVGGWGPREGVCAWAFGAAGLGASQGLTVAVIYGLFALVASLPGVAVLVARLLRRPRVAPQLAPVAA